MKANLHLHSRYSDGTQWPEAIALRARDLGLECIALTDHDTLEGTQELVAACEAMGMRGIVGVEIDCVDASQHYRSELLGYFPGGKCDVTLARLRERLSLRERLMRGYLVRAATLFERPDLAFDELMVQRAGDADAAARHAGRLTLTKPDLFNYLASKGVEACGVGYGRFKKEWFCAGRLVAQPEQPPTLGEVAGWIRADGGYPVLPHPGWVLDGDPERVRAERGRLRALLAHAQALGLWGVELYYYRDEARSAAINEVVRELGQGLGLAFTHGSDCHGPGSHIDSMALYSGDFGGFD